MKKILLLVSILFIYTTHVFAQKKVNESFGSSTFPPTGWSLVDPSGLMYLDATTNAYGSAIGVGSVYGDCYNISSGTATLETKIFTVTNAQDSLRFDIAYADYNSSYVDSFAVLAFNGSSYITLRAWAGSASVDTGMTTASATTSQFVPTLSQWRTKVLALPVGTTKVQFKFITGYGNEVYIDNIVVDSFFNATQTVDSCNAVQTFTSVVTQGTANQMVLQIPVYTTGNLSPKTLTNLFLSTNGCSNATLDLDSAKIYYTGSSNSFSPINRFGGVGSPNGSFTITGSRVLTPGVNYFWLVYDIKNTATLGNSIDAECVAITASSVVYVANISAPSGSYLLGRLYNFDVANNQNFSTSIITGTSPSEWQRGTPSTVGPAAAFSAPNCWGTNISGNYSIPASPNTANYGLYSPTYIANATNVKLAYKEFFNIYGSDVGVFQYKINSGAWTNLGSSVTGVSIGSTWQDKYFVITPSINDTIQFRWNFTANYFSIAAPGWYIDNFAIISVSEIDLTPPAISYTALINTSTFTNRTVTNFATITDASAIDTVSNKPRIYYKKKAEANSFGANNASYNGWKYAAATNNSSPFSFVVDYSLLYSSAIVGDTLQYFVVAQDLSAAHNTITNPSAGFVGSSVSIITSAPSSPNYYLFTASPLTGSYTVGSSANYATIGNAINDLNLRGVSGPVTLLLTNTSYTSATGETFPITINSIGGTSATNKVVIKPVSSGTTISGSASSIITFNGASFITIDGASSGTNRDLTINNTNTGTSATVLMASAGVGLGSTNDTIKNCIISNSGNYAGAIALNIGGVTVNSQGADNQNIYIINNQLCKSYTGITISGTSLNKASNIVVKNNLLGSSTATDYLFRYGALIQNSTNLTFTGNTIKNIISANNNQKAFYSSVGLSNSTISGNTIDSMFYSGTGGWGVMGIHVAQGSAITIANNMITRLWSDGYTSISSTDVIVGIKLEGGSGYNVYYNTVALTGTYAGYTSTTYNAAFYATTGTSGIDFRNNILYNSFVNTGNASSVSYAFASDAPSSSYTNINYNNYFVSGTQGVLGWANSAAQTTLGALTSSIGGNVNSKNVAVNFVSTGDAHLTGASIGNTNLGCAPISGITTDIDAQTRFATWHYMGADEIIGSPLPVALLSFTGNKLGADVVLNWVTSSEINNNYFVVERSLNGVDFDAINQVKGNGTSNAVNRYQFIDALSAENHQPSTIYYRLQQVDFDGKVTLSKIILVDFGGKIISKFESYPNPFLNMVTLNFDANEVGIMDIVLTNLQGQIVVEKTIDVVKGSNTKKLLELGELSKGIYFLKVILNNETNVFKLMK